MSEKVRGISKWVEIGDFEEALGSVNSKCQNDMVGMGWKRYWCTVTGLQDDVPQCGTMGVYPSSTQDTSKKNNLDHQFGTCSIWYQLVVSESLRK